MRPEPSLSRCAMVVCVPKMLMICGTYMSLWLGINGAMRLLVSPLCALLPFPMICTLILLLCALIINLLTMMRIVVPIMVSPMHAMLDIMP